MDAMTDADRMDRYPVHDTCDVCGHPHACYVGGRPRQEAFGEVRWELHICLGCLMRAGIPDGFASCADCSIGSSSIPVGRRDG